MVVVVMVVALAHQPAAAAPVHFCISRTDHGVLANWAVYELMMKGKSPRFLRKKIRIK